MIGNDVKYSVSARKLEHHRISELILHLYRRYSINITEIESFYGFVEYSSLYGGRPFVGREISEQDVIDIYNLGIGLRIPFTNHFVSYEEYKSQVNIFKKYHKDGNSIITVSDNLAKWIRIDFPKYKLEGSVIRRIRTLEQFKNSLEIYDSVIPEFSPYGMSLDEILKIKEKDRVLLFTGFGCEHFCKNQKCYVDISMQNKSKNSEKILACYRPDRVFDDKRSHTTKEFFIKNGFKRFKVVFGNPKLAETIVYYPNPAITSDKNVINLCKEKYPHIMR